MCYRGLRRLSARVWQVAQFLVVGLNVMGFTAEVGRELKMRGCGWCRSRKWQTGIICWGWWGVCVCNKMDKLGSN
ncbi:MAG: hypothetical protein ACKESB_00610 [Candidatus Hodgkinia cicadicola]